jgi:hypothetical protein
MSTLVNEVYQVFTKWYTAFLEHPFTQTHRHMEIYRKNEINRGLQTYTQLQFMLLEYLTFDNGWVIGEEDALRQIHPLTIACIAPEPPLFTPLFPLPSRLPVRG